MFDVGITERGDPALDLSWREPVLKGLPSILITKDPLALSKYITSDMNIIVHCTITGYGGTKLEPNVPPPMMGVKGLLKIIDIIGIERVVLRIDPIIMYDTGVSRLDVTQHLLPRIKNKLRKRISFLDNYDHVKKRFRKAGLKPPPYDFHAPLDFRNKVWKSLGSPEVCGEPGMICTCCVTKKDLNILGVEGVKLRSHKQRYSCVCLANKKELLDNKKQCKHGCLYCYWK